MAGRADGGPVVDFGRAAVGMLDDVVYVEDVRKVPMADPALMMLGGSYGSALCRREESPGVARHTVQYGRLHHAVSTRTLFAVHPCAPKPRRVTMCCMSEAQTVPEGLDFDMADRLRKALRFADISVQEMADELGMSRNSIGRYINGHIQPDLRTMRIWSWKTGAPLDWLQGEEWAARDSNSEPEGSSPDHGISTAELKTEFLRNIGLSGVTPARTGRPRHRAGVA